MIRNAGFAVVFAVVAACSSTPSRPPAVTPAVTPPVVLSPPMLRYEPAAWTSLPGWQADDLRAAWPALLASCASSRMPPQWSAFCAQARTINATNATTQRALIESQLQPWRVVLESTDGRRTVQQQGLITGYYEPVLNGSRRRGGAFQTPLYGVPDDLVTIELGDLYPALKGERIRGRLQGRRVVPFPERAQLRDGKVLAGKEIVWVDNPVDAFFLEIQGSGRVRLPDGSTIRIAYADVNGHPYRAIGRTLIQNGEMTAEQVTAPSLRQWLAEHPERQAEVMNSNPSVVFFREQALGNPAVGPNGAMGVPLTGGRSIAIDPRELPLGAPFFLATTHPVTGLPLERLVLGQDTGGAIRGGLRADVFWGMGPEAGDAAGRMRHDGSLWLLWPAGQPLPATASTASTTAPAVTAP